jgi:hypothetical protein
MPALSLEPWRAGLDEHYTLVAGSFKEKCSLCPLGFMAHRLDAGARGGIRKINLHNEYFKL